MGSLKRRLKRLECGSSPSVSHGWGVSSEEIHRQFLLLVLKRTAGMAEELGEPAQELYKLRDEYACLGVEEQIVRHDEFQNRVAQMAPKPYKALFEELDKELARI